MHEHYAILCSNLVKDERSIFETVFPCQTLAHQAARQWVLTQGGADLQEDVDGVFAGNGEIYAEVHQVYLHSEQDAGA